jgi:hypothetical protein
VSVVVVSTVVLLVGRRRRRPPTWAHRVAVDLGRGGRHRGAPRRRTETLTDYGERLGRLAPAWAGGLAEVCRVVERYSYGGLEPSAAEIGTALSFARRFARRGRRPRSADPRSPRAGPARTRPSQARAAAKASSNEAPTASSGR